MHDQYDAELDALGVPSFEEMVPLAWRGPAPTDPSVMLARLEEIRSEAIKGILVLRVCPLLGTGAVRHLDDVKEHGIERLMARGDDVFGRLQAVAIIVDSIRPLPGLTIKEEDLAYLNASRRMH